MFVNEKFFKPNFFSKNTFKPSLQFVNNAFFFHFKLIFNLDFLAFQLLQLFRHCIREKLFFLFGFHRNFLNFASKFFNRFFQNLIFFRKSFNFTHFFFFVPKM
eukprot:comp7763_c0_seq1/m.7991 comp7763_c0_seq1/g.7991  ORF comp7763_c0_seq1/g.7991 comp7763_c0_seq1/m.7991 type:complete len:103 (-) comp7763_c0_seq1:48-356(-)